MDGHGVCVQPGPRLPPAGETAAAGPGSRSRSGSSHYRHRARVLTRSCSPDSCPPPRSPPAAPGCCLRPPRGPRPPAASCLPPAACSAPPWPGLWRRWAARPLTAAVSSAPFPSPPVHSPRLLGYKTVQRPKQPRCWRPRAATNNYGQRKRERTRSAPTSRGNNYIFHPNCFGLVLSRVLRCSENLCFPATQKDQITLYRNTIKLQCNR